MSVLNPNRQRGGFQWYVVVTNTNQERLVKAQLTRLGFDAYLPMVPPPARARIRNGIAPGPRPMIPGYLFVCADTASPGWRDILSAMGVRQVISRGAGDKMRPMPVPGRLIEEIQCREVNGLVILPPPGVPLPEAKHRRGDKLVYRGPTADYEVIFQEMVDGDRAKVIFKLLGVDSLQVIALPSD